MADTDAFNGSTVLVTLHHPPGAQVRGVVMSISNQMLHLRDGEFTRLVSAVLRTG